jgi:hypothetical protein
VTLFPYTGRPFSGGTKSFLSNSNDGGDDEADAELRDWLAKRFKGPDDMRCDDRTGDGGIDENAVIPLREGIS